MGPGASLSILLSLDVMIRRPFCETSAPDPSDRSCWLASISAPRWRVRRSPPPPAFKSATGSKDRHDAFMDSFVFVPPTGRRSSPGVSALGGIRTGARHRERRRQFRGEPQVREDTAVTDAESQLEPRALGRPGQQRILSRIVAKLPLTWTCRKRQARRHTITPLRPTRPS